MLITQPQYRPYLLAVVVLVASGLIYGLFVKPQVDTEKREKLEYRQKLAEASSFIEEQRILLSQAKAEKATLSTQLDANEKRLADVSTSTTREIVRYAPGAPAPAPVVIVRDSDGKPVAQPPAVVQGFTPGQVLEIIRETSRTEDKSTSEATSKKTEMASSEKTEKTDSDTKKKTEGSSEASSDTSLKTEKTEKTTAVREADSRFGLGISDAMKPLATMDFLSTPLGPKPLGLGKLGAGVFLEVDPTGGSGNLLRDYGPQANYSRKKLFGMVGYGVKTGGPRFGVGLKF